MFSSEDFIILLNRVLFCEAFFEAPPGVPLHLLEKCGPFRL